MSGGASSAKARCQRENTGMPRVCRIDSQTSILVVAFQTLFGRLRLRLLSIFPYKWAVFSTTLVALPLNKYSKPALENRSPSLKMTSHKRVFLGCWVFLDEQDRFCEVSVDKSTIEEVCGPSDQEIDRIFQACKPPVKSRSTDY